MKLTNTRPKALFDEQNSHSSREIISQALEFHETKIKRFISVSLKMKIFRSTEEITERTDEIFQQMAVQALKKSAHFDPNRSVYSWLNGFAANFIKQTQNRVLNRREKFEDGFEDFERIENLRRKIETTPLPEEQLYEKHERDDEQHRFEEMISPLKKDYQRILRLHYLKDLEVGEIALNLGKSVGTAQRQLNRAETKMREILNEKRNTK